jgi:hypothetical protein
MPQYISALAPTTSEVCITAMLKLKRRSWKIADRTIFAQTFTKMSLIICNCFTTTYRIRTDRQAAGSLAVLFRKPTEATWLFFFSRDAHISRNTKLRCHLSEPFTQTVVVTLLFPACASKRTRIQNSRPSFLGPRSLSHEAWASRS